jgi:type VI secretion system protein ImpL
MIIHHQHSLPLLVGIIVIVGVLLALLVGLGLGALAEKKTKKEALKSLRETPDPEAEKAEERAPLFSGRWAEILALHGIFKVGPIAQAFLRILELLRRHTHERNWRYQIPWYLLVGPPHSGKSVLAENLRSLPISGYEPQESRKEPFRSFLFESGVLIECPGATLGKIGSVGIAPSWKLFGRLLKSFRPRSPANGLVLTLPYDLLAAQESVPGQKAQEAQHLFEHLWELQSVMNLRVPVYVLLTKSDQMPGFLEFCSQLSFSDRQQIFGWSSPYDLQTVFSPSWIDEMFESFSHGVKRASLAMAAQAVPSPTLEKALFVGSAIQSLREALQTYLSVVFRPLSEGKGLLLRGVYFVGQETDPVLPSAPSVDGTALNPENFERNLLLPPRGDESRVYFAQDLFDRKIFQETNLARPLHRDLIHGVTRATPWIRTGMVLSIAALLWGGHQSYNVLRRKVNTLEGVLGDVRDTLMRLQTVEKRVTTSEEQKHMNREIRKILVAMDAADPDMVSLYFPASWFSGLENRIQETLAIAFDHAVLRAMYLDLIMNARLLYKNSEREAHQEKVLHAVFPTETEEYKAFKIYAEKFLELEKSGANYNALREREDRNYVRSLTAYLFNVEFQPNRRLNGRRSDALLNFHEFDIESYAATARSTLTELYERFLERAFSKETWGVVQALSERIARFASALHHPTEEITALQVADLVTKMQSLLTYVKAPSLSWWEHDHFDPGGDYVHTISLLEESEVLGHSFVQKLLQKGETGLKAFRQQLVSVETPLTGRLFEHRKGHVISGPSRGFVRLTQDLQNLLAEPFMVSAKPKTLKMVVPEGKILYWDTRILKEAARLIDEYTDFCETRLDAFREDMQEIYGDLAHRILIPVVLALVARAQILEDTNDARVSASSIEERLRLQASNLKDSTAHFAKILHFLENVRSRRMYDGRLTALILEQVYRLLEKVDDVLEADGPYTVKNNLFSSWDGQHPANYAGFQVQDNGQLQNYLSTQRERIRFLAKELAEPLLVLLSTDPLCKQKHNKALLSKWKELIQQVDDYEKKKPGNSIAVLENFVTADLKNVDPKAARKALAEASEENGDFFLEQRAGIARALVTRAAEVSASMAMTYYQEISEHFNETLRGRFPFSDDIYSSESEAQMGSVERLTQLYETFAADVKAALEIKPHLAQDEKLVCQFLEEFTPIQNFLKLWVAHEKNHDPAASLLAFRVQFRAAQDREIAGKHVVEWKVKWGKNVIDVASPNKEILWHVGDPVDVVFRFAKNSPLVPILDRNNPTLGISGKTASFSYGGQMALFRLMASHAVSRQDSSGEGVVLKFTIPTVTKASSGGEKASNAAVLYIKLVPLKKEKDKWVPIPFPSFPKAVPALVEGVKHGKTPLSSPPPAKKL